MTTKYGGFKLYVVAPKAEKALRSLLGKGQPDHNGIRWKHEGWTAVKQYGANLVSVAEVWPQKKADANWKRLDARVDADHVGSVIRSMRFLYRSDTLQNVRAGAAAASLLIAFALVVCGGVPARTSQVVGGES